MEKRSITSASSLAGRVTRGPRVGTAAAGSAGRCAAAVEASALSARHKDDRSMAYECTTRPNDRLVSLGLLRPHSRWGEIGIHRRIATMTLLLLLLLQAAPAQQAPA